MCIKAKGKIMNNFKQLLKKIVQTSPMSFVFKMIESIIFGGRWRRTFTRKVLTLLYRSKFRSDWWWSAHPPHFSSHEQLESLFSDKQSSFYSIYRGVLTTELIKEGDILLDIGCGDGFFDQRFYSHKCKSIDAIDIEPSAIKYARKYNCAENINFSMLDAVNEPFPRSRYNVIAWDGALGHFSSETTFKMLGKIVDAVENDGIFCGSESLGCEGHDHLQFFETILDLRRIFEKHFKYIAIKETSYPINNNSFIRREAYWRCSNSEKFKNGFDWAAMS